MSTSYTLQHNSKSNHDSFSSSYREAYDYFKQSEKVSILGEGIKDILTDNSLFNEYVEKLSEGASATRVDELKTLMENARVNTLLEASTAGITPVASLTFPIIRKLWARTALTNAIPTEVVQQNAFTVSFNKPYIVDEQGNRHYLPEGLDNEETGFSPTKRLTESALTLPLDNLDLLAGAGCSKATGDSIDINFAVSAYVVTDNGTDVEVPVSRKVGKIDTMGKVRIPVAYKSATATINDTIFAFVNLVDGTIDATALKGTVKAIKIKGFVASDTHNHATNVSFEISKQEFTIGTGEHFEASLPLEFLQDAKAMYQVDGTAEVVDLLSNVVAQKLDVEIDSFINDVVESTNQLYYGEFDLRPSLSYAGAPKDWREELKTVIDYVATDLKSKSHAYQGNFAIIGHPLDMMLIPNTSWSFNHTTEEMDGVAVDYNIGAMSGEQVYQLISSDLVTKGSLRIVFRPTTDKFMSVKYYPYTFNVVNNYLNSRTPNVPNIMVTKRHTMEEFLPLVGSIKITGNTGKLLADLPR